MVGRAVGHFVQQPVGSVHLLAKRVGLEAEQESLALTNGVGQLPGGGDAMPPGASLGPTLEFVVGEAPRCQGLVYQ